MSFFLLLSSFLLFLDHAVSLVEPVLMPKPLGIAHLSTL